jgi:vancomycin permeability regulator SanA
VSRAEQSEDAPEQAPLSEAAPLPVALILGAAVWPGGMPSPALERRVRHALSLWQAGAVSRLICCGGVGNHPPAESQVMRAMLIEAGVPGEAIGVEIRSKDTISNIGNALAQYPELWKGQVLIVTDGFHAYRARRIAVWFGLDAESASAPDDDIPRGLLMRARLREAGAMVKTTVWMALHH